MKLGVSETAVAKWVKELGGNIRKRGVDEKIKDEIVRIYVQEEIGAPAIAKKFNLGVRVTNLIIKQRGATRTKAEANGISSTRTRTIGIGSKQYHYHSEKTGRWEFAASKYEAVRMLQLDADENVTAWTKDVPRIKYDEGKTYIPDFIIFYKQGRVVVEEIKPAVFVSLEINIKKWKAAKEKMAESNIEFRVVTENEIGRKEIKEFKASGFAASVQEVRDTIRKSKQSKRRKAKSQERKKYNYEWQDKNRTKHLQYRKKWREKNIEKEKDRAKKRYESGYMADWYKANPGKKKEYDERYKRKKEANANAYVVA
jgi:hypothetical protein